MPRYPLILSTLMGALALMGFTLAVTKSRHLAALFGLVYVALLIAWAWRCATSDKTHTADRQRTDDV